MSQAEREELARQLDECDDTAFGQFLQKQFDIMSKREKKWKTHLDTSAGVHNYRTARLTKRVIREAAIYEEQAHAYREAINKVGNILASMLERHEIWPAVYQEIMDTLNETDLRRI